MRPDLGTGGNVFIVQFVTQALPEFSAQIEQLGGKVYQFIPNYAYIVHMDAGTQAAVAALPFVRWVGAYEPGYRVEEVLRDNRANLEELFPYQRYNIQVFEAGLKQKHAVAERIKAIGGLVNEVGRRQVPAAGHPDARAALAGRHLGRSALRRSLGPVREGHEQRPRVRRRELHRDRGRL